MSLIRADEHIGTALLLDEIKRKANRTGKLRATAGRVSRGATEVMVKITGFGKGSAHVKAHLDYNTRNGKLELENERGDIFSGKEEVKAMFKEWGQDFGDSKRRNGQRDTLHMVLSMPEGTDPESVRNAARAFAQETFGQNHEYVFALHTDEPHPHVHLTVKMPGFDGKRLNPRKADLRHWREGFAQAMREQGVEAEATPRPSRGVVKKPESQVIRHIERGDKTHQPRKSRVKALKELEAIEEIKAEANGQPPAERLLEAKIQRQQTLIRGAWLAAANELKEAPDPDDRELGREIQRFVAAMPKIDTERHEIKGRLIERFSIQHEEAQAIWGAGQKEKAQTEVKSEPKKPQSKVKSQDHER